LLFDPRAIAFCAQMLALISEVGETFFGEMTLSGHPNGLCEQKIALSGGENAIFC